MIPDSEADEDSHWQAASAAVPAKRVRKSTAESGAGSSTLADETDAADRSAIDKLEGADQFGRHIQEIPAGVRADGTVTRARKRVVYNS